MKEIECPNCGAVFEAKEPKCPYCGHINPMGAEAKFLRDLEKTRKDMDQVDFYELMEKVLTHPAVIPLLPGGNEDGTVPLPPDADQAQ